MSPMRWAVALVALLVTPSNAIAQGSKCLPADAGGAQLISSLANIMTTRDSAYIHDRDQVYRVPVVDVASLTLVQDPRICERASAAYGPPDGGSMNPRVYVVKLGSKGWAVMNPEMFAGEFRTVLIFDAEWNEVGGFTGG